MTMLVHKMYINDNNIHVGVNPGLHHMAEESIIHVHIKYLSHERLTNYSLKATITQDIQ